MKHDESNLHELLCAYVLGEATDDERAKIEVALESDAELREERARLEATIGLVQGVLREPEQLSPAATRELLAKAGMRAEPKLWSHQGLRVAAALVVLIGGAVAFIPRSRPTGGFDDYGDELVAHGLVAKKDVQEERPSRALLEKALEEHQLSGRRQATPKGKSRDGLASELGASASDESAARGDRSTGRERAGRESAAEQSSPNQADREDGGIVLTFESIDADNAAPGGASKDGAVAAEKKERAEPSLPPSQTARPDRLRLFEDLEVAEPSGANLGLAKSESAPSPSSKGASAAQREKALTPAERSKLDSLGYSGEDGDAADRTSAPIATDAANAIEARRRALARRLPTAPSSPEQDPAEAPERRYLKIDGLDLREIQPELPTEDARVGDAAIPEVRPQFLRDLDKGAVAAREVTRDSRVIDGTTAKGSGGGSRSSAGGSFRGPGDSTPPRRGQGDSLLSNVIFEVQGPMNGPTLDFLGNQYYLSSTIEWGGIAGKDWKPRSAGRAPGPSGPNGPGGPGGPSGTSAPNASWTAHPTPPPLVFPPHLLGRTGTREFPRVAGESDEDFAQRLIEACEPQEFESPGRMFYRFWGDNAFEYSLADSLSTFSIDVDTASYALSREYLRAGMLPPEAAVRTEEFVNYFKADVPAPTTSDFGIHTELAPSLFGDGTAESWMMRVVVRGREVTKTERAPLCLTFVVDTSGSMNQGNRMELVKHALRLLVGELDANDSIAIVAFGSEARLMLPMISVAYRSSIEVVINALEPNGGTNAEAGLRLGYAQAFDALREGAGNRVVFLSDGVANVGQTDQERLAENVREQRVRGVYLNTIGVGLGNHNDVFLEQLADQGDGLCNYVNDAAEARRAIVENFTGAFETIAGDVKLQVEFDPEQVESYRLLGYENRAVADRDFRNDRVDAGEVGAGHQVTALYELVRVGGRVEADVPLATVRMRWKQPRVPSTREGEPASEPDVTELEHRVVARDAASSFLSTSAGYRRSVLVAQFAEFLRRSRHARSDSVDLLVEESERLALELRDPVFDEFVALVKASADLIRETLVEETELEQVVDALRANHVLRARYDELRAVEAEPSAVDDRDLLDRLERQNHDLEARIQDLVRTDDR